MGYRRSYGALVALVVASAAFTAEVAAGEIVRWVDAQGVTQFTDAHLAAPAALAEIVDVQPANGMVVPTGAPPSSVGRPSFTKISRPPKKNKRGWRGYQTTRKRNSHSRRR